MTNTISLTEAHTNFQDVLNRVEHGGERMVIERQGKAALAILKTCMHDVETLHVTSLLHKLLISELELIIYINI
ncbi:MAG: type II toxin-antitoxin system Phd/YefM family antitoxin [Calothrix sp. FI2-JRJ7]|jgi:PHD/YefM family antitoxin component YafN of YafNO toxin-antitoxin module|nr:type II toxin-antitoxin system Phd/YefM family antitoxin [Calothrix sp. FI2-JRJ7]